jgi:hypothetical protein
MLPKPELTLTWRMVTQGDLGMARERVENHWLVIGTCLLAILGVMMMRISLGLDFRFWAGAYMAMALTAAVRRTSEGSDYTVWSALRGFACLFLGLYATQWLGCPEPSYRSVALFPEEFLEAIVAIRDGVQNGH